MKDSANDRESYKRIKTDKRVHKRKGRFKCTKSGGSFI